MLIVSNVLLQMDVNEQSLRIYELEKDVKFLKMSDGEKLMRAIPNGNIDVFKNYLSKSSANTVGPYGIMPLHIAVNRSQVEMVKLLLDIGADINAQTHKGDSVLHIAVQKQNIEIINLILARKPQLNIRDNKGKTAKDLAIETSNEEITELLRKVD